MEIFSNGLTEQCVGILFGASAINTWGALAGLLLSIFFILRKMPPFYSLMFGALAGGLIGQGGISESVDIMIKGAGDIMPAVLRILSAGILAGILIRSGAAAKIASVLIEKGSSPLVLPALAFTTLVLTTAGVFIDIAVITVSPIALAAGARIGISKTAILIAMIGGGKAGNIMSPNPNTISLSENMKVPLMDLMLAGILPALGAFMMTCLIAYLLRKKKDRILPENYSSEATASATNSAPAICEGKSGDNAETTAKRSSLTFLQAMAGPGMAIMLLILRPTLGIKIDPLIALPAGGLFGLFCMRQMRNCNEFASFGLSKMAPVALLLIGTGCLAGIITGSELKDSIIRMINWLGLPAFSLAPLAGILLGGATASTTAGSTVASAGFGAAITELGFSPLQGGVMIHAGTTVIDSLPHGSFFHATAGTVFMSFSDRLKVIPYEMAIGLTQTILAVLIYGVFKWF